MFNVGSGEFLVIALIALIVLGPDKLPNAARQVGKVMADLRRLSSGFQQEMRQAMDVEGLKANPGPTLPPLADGSGTTPTASPAPTEVTASTLKPADAAPAAPSEPTLRSVPSEPPSVDGKTGGQQGAA